MLPYFELRDSKGGSGRQRPLNHRRIKVLHKLGGRLVGNLPETRDYTRSSREHECPRQTDQSLAQDLLSKRGFTRTQHNEIRTELQSENFRKWKESIYGPPLPVDQRKDHGGLLRMAAVEHAVRSKVQDSILVETGLQQKPPRCREIRTDIGSGKE